MHPAAPSSTALRVALRRAAHQLYDPPPLVLEDPIAVPLLLPAYAEALSRTAFKLEKPFSVALRAFLVARARYAEDTLASAVARPLTHAVTQYVLLGAGLDTFAHRNPHPRLHVFEVDHPATQAWKRDLLSAAHLPAPPRLTFVPVDFEADDLPTALAAAGHNPTLPTVFAALGVVPYLTAAAFRATLAFVAAQPPGSALVCDYAQPRDVLPPGEQLARDSLSARVAAAGEPFRLFFTPAEIAGELSAFHNIEDLGSPEINARYFPHSSDAGRPEADGPDALRTRGSSGRLLSAYR